MKCVLKVSALIVAALLAACGGGGGGGEAPQQVSNQQPASAVNAPPVTPVAIGQPVTTPQAGAPVAVAPTSRPGDDAASAPRAGDQPGPTAPVNTGPTIPEQVGAGAPPVNCGAAHFADCPPGTTWTGVPLNCGSQICPVGPNVTPTQPGTPAPMRRPDVTLASADEIAAWNERCGSTDCMIALPAPSGRTLTWWGADPRLIEQQEAAGAPAIPDGDKLLWNFACAPQPTCRIRLSQQY
jgi:hypothetical protein